MQSGMPMIIEAAVSREVEHGTVDVSIRPSSGAPELTSGQRVAHAIKAHGGGMSTALEHSGRLLRLLFSGKLRLTTLLLSGTWCLP